MTPQPTGDSGAQIGRERIEFLKQKGRESLTRDVSGSELEQLCELALIALSTPPLPQQVEQGERERFEAWVLSKDEDVKQIPWEGHDELVYLSWTTRHCWEAWQAASRPPVTPKLSREEIKAISDQLRGTCDGLTKVERSEAAASILENWLEEKFGLPSNVSQHSKDVAHDKGYLNGLRQGWQFARANDEKGMEAAEESYLHQLKQASRPVTPGVEAREVAEKVDELLVEKGVTEESLNEAAALIEVYAASKSVTPCEDALNLARLVMASRENEESADLTFEQLAQQNAYFIESYAKFKQPPEPQGVTEDGPYPVHECLRILAEHARESLRDGYAGDQWETLQCATEKAETYLTDQAATLLQDRVPVWSGRMILGMALDSEGPLLSPFDQKGSESLAKLPLRDYPVTLHALPGEGSK